ncbi:MAG: 37S ribosomal protein S9, mitochondrial [Claussenomyces sp. TS43310]|nr:MAG: 37S ribosomal protein S9, mitochondrial [Claussenomyces sp. TS43310]
MKVAWLRTGVARCARSTTLYRPFTSKPLLRQQLLSQSYLQAFSTSSRRAIAAPEIKFPAREEGNLDFQSSPTFAARVVPESPSYFTGSPSFTDNILYLRGLLRKYITLPTVKPGEAPRVAWRSIVEYRNMVGEVTKATKYHKIVDILQRLNHIQPALMPQEVKIALNRYKRDIDPNENVPNPPTVDRFGRALGVGRRKASTARAWIIEGTGEVLINGKPLTEAFGRVHDRESVIWALKATERIDKYNVWALAEGGGTTGQAEALTLAVAKALLTHEPLLKPALRRAGCITRDPRRVERKKPGHLKARKMPAWVRR